MISEEEANFLKERIKALEAQVTFLLKEVERLTHKKNSRNSSIPPSSDLTRKSQSLRVKSDRSSGGQLGHSGTTLNQSQTPDIVTELKSDFCSCCGSPLTNAEYTLESKRQVVDIAPPPPPTYHEYQQYSCKCPNCSHIQKADFPDEVVAPIQYGDTVHALISYLSVKQYTPYLRLKEHLTDLYNLPMSQGSIDNCLIRGAQREEPMYHQIGKNIPEASVVGSDETSAKVNGSKWWIWIWQTVLDTFLLASPTRGFATILKAWQNGLLKSALVSDRLAAQLKTTARLHQICLAHLLREIIFIEEIEDSECIRKLKTIILEIFEYKRNMTEDQPDNSPPCLSFESNLNSILAIPLSEEQFPLALKFQHALIKVRGNILPCIYEVDIPPDNNGSERGIRNVRVKLKVSGQFKSRQQIFCIHRSIIDSLKKRGVPVFETLCQIMSLRPEPIKRPE